MTLSQLCFRVSLCLFSCTLVFLLLADISPLEKTYLLPSQLYLIPEGIFFMSAEGELESTSTLFADGNGPYVLQKFQQCPACHLWSRDGTLHRTSCPFYAE
ncbi:hypothetical protein [Parachlamydia sp. AcF125]|uniref:hypothetical protein n=1 Tax=Parachlamydia sp. AcF125 TaxID=2795736 RepID=UPI001BCA2272|nr:hypothetical protein [Parachlamydia sp. AcF125]MBS4167895.1 hypothetical protein [Parachlamydia sp. AcF125]